MLVRYKKEHTIQFTKVQYFCHYAKKMDGFYVIKRERVKREGGGKESKASKESKEIREIREIRGLWKVSC